jgi:hypothetical protein
LALAAAAWAEGAAPPVESGPRRPWTGVIKAHGTCTDGSALSADGNTLVTVGGDRMVVSDLRTGKVLRQRTFGGHQLCDLALVSADKEVACVVEHEQVQLLDLATLKTRATIGADLRKYGRLWTVAASRGGKRLAVVGRGAVGVWDVAAARELWRKALDSRIKRVYEATFSPDGKTLALAVDDRDLLRLHDAGTGREVDRLPFSHEVIRLNDVGGLAYLHDGRSLVYAFRRYDFIHVREISTGKLTSSLTWRREDKPAEKRHARQGSDSLAVSPDGKTLAASGCDRCLRLFEVATGGLRRVIASGDGQRVRVRVLFCPDGRLVRLDVPKEGHVDVSDWRDAAKGGKRSEDDLKRAWEDLGSKEAEVGFRAISRLLNAPERQALTLLAELPRAEPLSEKQIARLIEGLDDDDPDVRERATEDLKYAGQRAEKALRAALAKPPSLEVKKRATAILKNLTPLRPERLRFLRAVEVLEALGSPAAQKQLERLAGGLAGTEETEDARAALARIGQRSKR